MAGEQAQPFEERRTAKVETFAAARVEEELRARLALEQARSAALERDLETLRSSESFRVGHLLVEGLGARLRWNAPALARAAFERLRGRRSVRKVTTRSRAPAARRRTGRSTLFIVWGAGEPQLEAQAARVERLQAVLVDLAPLFVVDSMAAEPLRRRGFPVEYLIPLSQWCEHRYAHDWGVYVTRRIAEVRRTHRPDAVVVLESDSSTSALDQGLVNPILRPGMAETDDNEL